MTNVGAFERGGDQAHVGRWDLAALLRRNLRTSGIHAACSSGVPDIAQTIEEQPTNVSVSSILRNIMMSVSL